MGPMQFLPGTWARYASDGDGDGTADPQNLYDATLAAARYLCSGGLNLRDQSQVLSSILRYNNSMPYAQNVLGWAAAYATGVVPVDLPPLTGPAPPLGDAHLEHAEGLGPNLPLNMHGLAATDPLARMPLIDLSGNAGNGQPSSAQGPAGYGPSCTVICIGQQTPGPAQVNAPPANAVAPPAAPAPFGMFPPPPSAPFAPFAPPAPPLPPDRPLPRRPVAPFAPPAAAPPRRSAPPAAAPAAAAPAPAACLLAAARAGSTGLTGRSSAPVRAARHALDSAMMSDPTAHIRAALAKVIDPELRRPITELGMVKGVELSPGGDVHVEIYLTTSACPKKTEISDRVRQAVADVPGTGTVKVSLDVMNDEQRTELRKQLRGDSREPVIPFAQPGSLTRVYAVASGKGGVGKSTVTVNLAAAMAARGMSVGLLDADIHGHSIPRMMGTTDRPTQVESMILPPIAHEVKVISIAQFTQENTPVVWRGPMLHRALQQFLADVYWGDLDVLLLDLPPGTGDIAISVAQLIPERRDHRRHHAATGGGRGRRTGRQHRAADQAARRRRGGEHVRVTAAGRLDDAGVRRGRRRTGRRAADPRRWASTCRCSGRFRWTPRWSRPATPGCRSCSAPPTHPSARS